jgi:glycine/D-amino acid oxidase-like deaminating enzyme
MDSLEVVTEVKALNEWNDRSAEPELSGYISTEETGSHAHALSDYLKLFRVNQGGWLDIPLFLDLYRSSWIKEGKMALLKTTDHPCREAISMKKTAGIEADRVVWCEGQSARKNPLWSWLPFDPVKGELLTLEIPDLPQTEIVVHGIFLIPLGDSLFRAGATYSWHELDHLPTDSAKQKLTDKLQRTLKVPFRIIGHQAGIRPAVKGRRPLLGRHPDHPDQWIFNGLGSKGSTLAPWFADHYKEHLLSGKPLMAEVDISRFSDK